MDHLTNFLNFKILPLMLMVHFLLNIIFQDLTSKYDMFQQLKKYMVQIIISMFLM